MWDEELAAIAQRWADQCVWGHDPRNDRVVSRSDFKSVGQNSANADGPPGPFENFVLNWYNGTNEQQPIPEIEMTTAALMNKYV